MPGADPRTAAFQPPLAAGAATGTYRYSRRPAPLPAKRTRDVALTPTQLDALATWCMECDELAAERRAARRTFFDEDDRRPARYPPGVGDLISRDRRFLGWFMFDYRLADGRRPVDVAVPHVMTRRLDVEDACAAIAGVRHVFGIVETVLRDRVVLELEDERFEVRQRQWTQFLQRDDTIAAHLLPVRRGEWLAGPGWVHLALGIGAGPRPHLKSMQLSPIDIERPLQARPSNDEDRDEAAGRAEAPTFDEAVAEMSALAERIGRPALAMPADEWRALVETHFDDVSVTDFVTEVMERGGEFADRDQANEVLALVQQIWNATPQPDRGGLSATELARLARIRRAE